MDSTIAIHQILDKTNWKFEEIRACLDQDSSSVYARNNNGFYSGDTIDGDTPLLRVLRTPKKKDFFRTIKLLLDHGAEVDIHNSRLDTPVFSLLEFCKSEIWKDVFSLFIKKGLSLNKADVTGLSYVCIALRYLRPASDVQYLLEVGCSLNACERHASPFHCWVRSKRTIGRRYYRFRRTVDVFELFLKVVEDVPGIFKDPTVLLSIFDMRMETPTVIRLLHDRLQDLSILKDVSDNTLLHFACRTFCRDDVLKLLIKLGVKVDRVNNIGNTALHESLSKSITYENMIRVLLEKGSPVNAKNAFGETPLHIAAKHTTEAGAIKLLIIAGAQIGSTSVLKSFIDSHASSLKTAGYKRNRLNCFKMLVKCYFLENHDFDLQSLSPGKVFCEELLKFGVDCGSEIQKLDSKNITLRKFLYKYPLQTNISQTEKSCYLNQLLQIIAENSCPILSDIIKGKACRLAMEQLEDLKVYVVHQRKRVTLNYYCVFKIANLLEDKELLNFVSAFHSHVCTTEASKEEIFEDEEKVDSFEQCRKRPKLQDALQSSADKPFSFAAAAVASADEVYNVISSLKTGDKPPRQLCEEDPDVLM